MDNRTKDPHTEVMRLADDLYKKGYSDYRKEQDYDPRGSEEWQSIVDFTRTLTDRIAELEAQLEAVAAQAVEIERLRKDAKRYRCVRSNPAMLLHLSNEEFDSAIDAAIAKEAAK